MKKIAMALALLLAAASCDFLDVVPEGSPTQDDIYKTQAQAEKMLFMVYGKCPDLFHAQAMPDLSGGDDLISSYYGSVRYFSWKSLVYATSQESPTNTYFNMWGTTSGLPTGNYSYNIYEGIRYAYNFLNNIGSVPDISEANLRYWSGEAHFLIAHLHQILLEYYGPIVLAREEIDLNAPASSVNVPRSTYDECVNFIEEEFRKAADMLPDYWGPIAYGRAIKATALAYRARLLLYAASPLVNGNSEFYADFVNKDGTHLINQTYDAEKWKRAMDAAKEAIDCVEASKETGAYTMDDRQLGLSVSKSTSTTDPFELGRANYTYIFTGDGNATQFLNQNEYLMSLNKSGSPTRRSSSAATWPTTTRRCRAPTAAICARRSRPSRCITPGTDFRGRTTPRRRTSTRWPTTRRPGRSRCTSTRSRASMRRWVMTGARTASTAAK